VIEIPTPRWTAYDVTYFGLEGVDPQIPMVTRERAYTSPIGYTSGRERKGLSATPSS
jgi:hypothetical protein